MDKLSQKISALKGELEVISQRLNLPRLQAESQALKQQSAQADFWQDSGKAQAAMKRLSELNSLLGPWQELIKGARELADLVNLNDAKLHREIETQLLELETKLSQHQSDQRFSGPYDQNSAILGIYAGAGGTDAQDWAQILMRMYSRWAEQKGLKVRLLDQTAGEETGLKTVTLNISGPTAYGRLKGEHGVHRLVRLSPFNADQKRHTSFAKVELLPEIDQNDQLEISEADLKIDVFRAGGHGGQSVNTTDSAVRLTHIPTGLSVSIQNERSQLKNKATALTILSSRLARLMEDQHQEKLSELKGPSQSAEWGNQIRSYVMHPYKQVKDLRSGYETTDINGVLDGQLDELIDAYLKTLPSA